MTDQEDRYGVILTSPFSITLILISKVFIHEFDTQTR